MPVTYPRIVFGEIEFIGKDFINASLTEEFSPLCITLPINVLEFSVFSDDVDFSIINPSGKFETLASRQPMAVYEVVDGVQKYLGQYYLEDWENESENIKKFTCYDVLGLINKVDYLGGVWLTPATVGALVADVLDPLDVHYEIDPDVAAIELTGWLPISTCREALQQIAFAAGAYVLSARQDSIVIGKLTQAATETSGVRSGVAHAGQSRNYKLRWRKTQNLVYASGGVVTKGMRSGIPASGQSRVYSKRWRTSQWEGAKPIVEIQKTEQGDPKPILRAQVTGVEITGHDIIEGTGSLEITNQAMTAGLHAIHFSQPMHTLSITGGTIISSGANYAIINVATAGTVVLSGLVYVDSDRVFSQYLPAVPGRKENIIKITDATLVNSGNGPSVCNAIFNYYQQRYLQKMRLYSPSKYTEVGAMVDIETLYSNRLLGTIERMTTNLAGGNVADTEVIGVIK